MMTKFEKLTLSISAIALFISLTTSLTSPVLSLIGRRNADLTIQRELPIYWISGKFRVVPYFQIQNVGTVEFRPERIEMTFTMESGQKISLVGKYFSPAISNSNSQQGASLQLSDSNVDPGKILPGTVTLEEKIPQATIDEYEDLDSEVVSSTKTKLQEKQKQHEILLQKLVDKLLPGVGSLSIERISALLPALNSAVFVEPDENLQQKASSFYERSTARFQKGEHKVSINLIDFSGRTVFSKEYRVTIFDRDVKKLKGSFMGIGSVGAGGARSYVTPTENFPVVILRDG